jgi:hypothetical protein
MPTITITWHTQHDDRVCPICEAIDGYVFGPYTEVPDSLIHPVYGEIWNIYLGSLAHEQPQFGKKYGLLSSCRCHTTNQLDARDLLYLLQKKIDELKGKFTEENDYQTGNSRKTTFEDIGVDPSKYGFE